MPKFRDKRLVEAVRFDGDHYKHSMVHLEPDDHVPGGPLTQPRYYIMTGHGRLKIVPGDWIITEPGGSYFVCDHEAFVMRYEEVK